MRFTESQKLGAIILVFVLGSDHPNLALSRVFFGDTPCVPKVPTKGNHPKIPLEYSMGTTVGSVGFRASLHK